MALNTSSIVSAAKSKLKAKGFVLDNEFSKQSEMIEAIVEAVVEGITSSAQVQVTGGSSSGTYQVK